MDSVSDIRKSKLEAVWEIIRPFNQWKTAVSTLGMEGREVQFKKKIKKEKKKKSSQLVGGQRAEKWCWTALSYTGHLEKLETERTLEPGVGRCVWHSHCTRELNVAMVTCARTRQDGVCQHFITGEGPSTPSCAWLAVNGCRGKKCHFCQRVTMNSGVDILSRKYQGAQ